jgi:hypothetical protein
MGDAVGQLAGQKRIRPADGFRCGEEARLILSASNGSSRPSRFRTQAGGLKSSMMAVLLFSGRLRNPARLYR